ncbi:MAG: ATP-binding protein [Actinomycetota bacterium]|nr:ATP-binding protein [Actinomycetota bacterium]
MNSSGSGSADVLVTVPARAEFMQLLRSAVGSIAARLDFTYETIDDLRIAVDEACARILSVPGEPTSLTLRITPMQDRIEVLASTDGKAEDWPPEDFEESLTAKILDALVDEVSFERVGRSPAVRVVKRATFNT